MSYMIQFARLKVVLLIGTQILSFDSFPDFKNSTRITMYINIDIIIIFHLRSDSELSRRSVVIFAPEAQVSYCDLCLCSPFPFLLFIYSPPLLIT